MGRGHAAALLLLPKLNRRMSFQNAPASEALIVIDNAKDKNNDKDIDKTQNIIKDIAEIKRLDVIPKRSRLRSLV